MPNQLKSFSPIHPELEYLHSKILNLMNIPSINLVTYIDEFDSSHYQLGDKKALYKNIQYLGWKPFHDNELLSIRKNIEVDHLIWMSCKVAAGEQIDFVWTLAHELQHLLQSLQDRRIPENSNFICEAWSKSSKCNRHSLQLPDEFDADRTAKEIVEKIYGADLTNEYFQSMGEPYATEFKKAESLFCGNVRDELIRILKADLEYFLKLEPEISKENNNFPFDIRSFIKNIFCQHLS